MLGIRKIGVFERTYRHLNRYRQILAVLFKHGFGGLIEQLNIDEYVEIGLRMMSEEWGGERGKHPHHTRAHRVRMALEELGPTYIKLGQILSTRSDLIPPDYIRELTDLQDNVQPFPCIEVKKIIAEELNKPPQDLFEYFEEHPIASASIGQVHRARLRGGENVAVKIQRPGIQRIIEVDLEIMLHLATLMERHIEDMAFHQPVKVVEEFTRVIEKEIDYTIEASNMERFSRQCFGDPTIYVPKVFRELSTDRVLTMEFILAIKVSEIKKLENARLDRKKITVRGAKLLLKQIFDDGFFHADPHPGNIHVLPGNVICLLDFGMMGSIDRQTREDFVDLIFSAVEQDEVKASRVLLHLTTWEYEPDLRHLEKDVADFMGQHLYKSLKDIQIGKVIQQMFELVSRHRMRIPPDIFLMLKALSTIEGVALRLDPDFDMIAQAAPFIRRIKLSRFYPRRLAEDMFSISEDLLHFIKLFPKDMIEIARLIKSKKLSLKFEHHGLERMLATHDQISNKLSFAIIIASLIIGSSIIVNSEIPPLVYGISLIGIVVFIAAAIMGIWLMVAILKRGDF